MADNEVTFFNIQGDLQRAQLHCNPLVKYACATDEIEDMIQRYGKRRGGRGGRFHGAPAIYCHRLPGRRGGGAGRGGDGREGGVPPPSNGSLVNRYHAGDGGGGGAAAASAQTSLTRAARA
eukprot:g14093.t1